MHKCVRLFTTFFQNPFPIIHCVHNSNKAYSTFIRIKWHMSVYLYYKSRTSAIAPSWIGIALSWILGLVTPRLPSGDRTVGRGARCGKHSLTAVVRDVWLAVSDGPPDWSYFSSIKFSTYTWPMCSKHSDNNHQHVVTRSLTGVVRHVWLAVGLLVGRLRVYPRWLRGRVGSVEYFKKVLKTYSTMQHFKIKLHPILY